MIETEVLVVGGGVAGAVAALRAADCGAQEVTLLQRGTDDKSTNTYWAQGGIIYTSPQDTPDLLTEDILGAGAGLSWEPAARILAEEGPRCIDEILIKQCGVPFDKNADGSFKLTEEAAHSCARILHCEDRTGVYIARGLREAVEAHPRIKVLSNWVAIDLLTYSHHSLDALDRYQPPTCFGVYALDRTNNEVRGLLARETVLATGGMGQLYLHSTNPKKARGDGIAMAWRARARLLNLEFVQFHPTALYHERLSRYLISESLRGEGARLILSSGEEFMEKYDPRGSLAPRDVVARAIHEELIMREDPCVYLDLTHKDPDWVRSRFPGVQATCQRVGIDIATDPIPVVPAAHYSCGGIATDLEGRTSINGLWAVGEVACTGLHGANRLASTSLLEGLVYGARAAEAIAQQLRANNYRPYPAISPWINVNEPSDPALILQDWQTIKYTMWNYVGLARTQKRLHRAAQILTQLRSEVQEFYNRTRLDDELIGLRNGIQSALAVLYAAMGNRRSQGCHYLVDQESTAPPPAELKI